VESDEERRFTVWALARVSRLHRTAYLLCGDWHAAEDLVQDALARAALHWRRIEGTDSPDAYVRKILLNEARKRWRPRRAKERPSLETNQRSIDDGSSERAARAELMQALSGLPPRQRAAVVLRYFEQLSEAETAAALGCSVGTIKSSTHRALATLRHTLTSEANPC
jgi:RNA polymerase sigma-70 factor (sigma-E family)